MRSSTLGASFPRLSFHDFGFTHDIDIAFEVRYLDFLTNFIWGLSCTGIFLAFWRLLLLTISFSLHLTSQPPKPRTEGQRPTSTFAPFVPLAPRVTISPDGARTVTSSPQPSKSESPPQTHIVPTRDPGEDILTGKSSRDERDLITLEARLKRLEEELDKREKSIIEREKKLNLKERSSDSKPVAAPAPAAYAAPAASRVPEVPTATNAVPNENLMGNSTINPNHRLHH